MHEKITGDLVVKSSSKFALVVADFNEFITSKLAGAAAECLLRHGGKESQITEVHVPGSFEIPTVASQLAQSGKYAAVICLGCVIRGQTTHYDHVVDGVTKGIAAIGPATGVPAIFGIITADTVEQALDRAGLKHGNTGWNAALAAITMVSVMSKIK